LSNSATFHDTLIFAGKALEWSPSRGYTRVGSSLDLKH
jgi:hypothetical protein